MRADLRKYRSSAGSEGGSRKRERSKNKITGARVKRATIISGKWAAFEDDYLSGGKKSERERALHAGRKTTYAWWITDLRGRERERKRRQRAKSRLTRSCGSRKTMVPPVSFSFLLRSLVQLFFPTPLLSPPFGWRGR